MRFYFEPSGTTHNSQRGQEQEKLFQNEFLTPAGGKGRRNEIFCYISLPTLMSNVLDMKYPLREALSRIRETLIIL